MKKSSTSDKKHDTVSSNTETVQEQPKSNELATIEPSRQKPYKILSPDEQEELEYK